VVVVSSKPEARRCRVHARHVVVPGISRSDEQRFSPTHSTDHHHNYRGFSLLELLVVLAVALMLLGLLMPGLQRMREAAWHVACASNEHQIAIAMAVYADDHNERLPYTWFAGERAANGDWDRVPQPSQMMTLYRGDGYRPWDGSGCLSPDKYINNPEIFYCPAHRGRHPFERYEQDWIIPDQEAITGNYHYRGILKNPKVRGIYEYTLSRLQRDRMEFTVLSDGLATKSDFSHTSGTNLLKIDFSVEWYNDNGGQIFELLPDEDQGDDDIIHGIWNLFDGNKGEK